MTDTLTSKRSKLKPTESFISSYQDTPKNLNQSKDSSLVPIPSTFSQVRLSTKVETSVECPKAKTIVDQEFQLKLESKQVNLNSTGT